MMHLWSRMWSRRKHGKRERHNATTNSDFAHPPSPSSSGQSSSSSPLCRPQLARQNARKNPNYTPPSPPSPPRFSSLLSSSSRSTVTGTSSASTSLWLDPYSSPHRSLRTEGDVDFELPFADLDFDIPQELSVELQPSVVNISQVADGDEVVNLLSAHDDDYSRQSSPSSPTPERENATPPPSPSSSQQSSSSLPSSSSSSRPKRERQNAMINPDFTPPSSSSLQCSSSLPSSSSQQCSSSSPSSSPQLQRQQQLQPSYTPPRPPSSSSLPASSSRFTVTGTSSSASTTLSLDLNSSPDRCLRIDGDGHLRLEDFEVSLADWANQSGDLDNPQELSEQQPSVDYPSSSLPRSRVPAEVVSDDGDEVDNNRPIIPSIPAEAVTRQTDDGDEVDNLRLVGPQQQSAHDDDYSSTSDDTSVSPNGCCRVTITDWQKGIHIGRGSFGTVYRGLTGDGLFFAVKEVCLLDAGCEKAIQSLEQEIELLSKLEHENIVKYLGTKRDDTNLYIFLELVTEGSLVKIYREYKLEESLVSMYTRQILLGLKFLHDKRIVHRDIKCANILVAANGTVKLADFGLAKVSQLSNLNSTQGSIMWMAPEVIKCELPGYGRSADIWSLGCTVLEMLTRHHPYHPKELCNVMFLLGIARQPPEIPENLSSDARDFLLKCLQVQPSARPSADELLRHPFVMRSIPSISGP